MTYIRFYGNYTICRVKFIRIHVNAHHMGLQSPYIVQI